MRHATTCGSGASRVSRSHNVIRGPSVSETCVQTWQVPQPAEDWFNGCWIGLYPQPIIAAINKCKWIKYIKHVYNRYIRDYLTLSCSVKTSRRGFARIAAHPNRWFQSTTGLWWTTAILWRCAADDQLIFQVLGEWPRLAPIDVMRYHWIHF